MAYWGVEVELHLFLTSAVTQMSYKKTKAGAELFSQRFSNGGSGEQIDGRNYPFIILLWKF
jgi:hypothetical protein